MEQRPVPSELSYPEALTLKVNDILEHESWAEGTFAFKRIELRRKEIKTAADEKIYVAQSRNPGSLSINSSIMISRPDVSLSLYWRNDSVRMRGDLITAGVDPESLLDEIRSNLSEA
jgi:hypothetical protein